MPRKVAKLRNFEAAAEYPLSVALAPLGARRGARREGTSTSVNIVSPGLCEDALRRLAPSLEEYKGCNIIDLNPGPGLWSSTLHGFLKPRAHYLLEPQKAFHPFLKELLEQQLSRYRLIPQSGLSPEGKTFDVALMERLLHECDSERKDKGAQLPQLNKSTLMLANLTSLKKNAQLRIPMVHYILAMIRNASMHCLGPVRMLLWVPEEEKFHYLPRTLNTRTTMSRDLDIISSVSEIVGAIDTKPHPPRLVKADVSSAISTAWRMIDANDSLPLARRSKLHEEALNTVLALQERTRNTENLNAAPGDNDLSSMNLLDMVCELDDLKRGYFLDGKYKMHQSQDDPLIVDKRYKTKTREYSRMLAIIARLESITSNKSSQIYDTVETCLLISEDLDYLECAYSNLDILHPTRPFRKKELDELAMKLSQAMKTIDRTRNYANPLADDASGFWRKSPLLAWDRRLFEPMETHADEFYPQSKLALLDIVPRDISQTSKIFALNRQELFKTIRMYEKLPIEEALERLAHGCASALIPVCPSLRDFSKGGRLRLEHFRARMLTLEMMQELSEAWDRWPFKKSSEELLARANRGLNGNEMMAAI